jgi:hypothetical protein
MEAATGAWLSAQAVGRRTGTDPGPQHDGPEHDGPEHDGPEHAGLVAVAVDGKTVRGALGADGQQVHLLDAATHGEQLVLGQVEVGANSNEIPQVTPLLDGLTAAGVDLRGVVATADALHSQRGRAE